LNGICLESGLARELTELPGRNLNWGGTGKGINIRGKEKGGRAGEGKRECLSPKFLDPAPPVMHNK